MKIFDIIANIIKELLTVFGFTYLVITIFRIGESWKKYLDIKTSRLKNKSVCDCCFKKIEDDRIN